MAEENSIGTSRLLQGVSLGTNNVQSAADSVTAKFEQVAQAASSVVSAFQTVGKGNSGGPGGSSNTFFTNAWNNTSNSARYGGNGGGGSFSGMSFSSQGRGNGGGGTFSGGSLSRGNKIATTAGAAAGIASAFNSYANKNMNSMMQMNYFGTQSAMIGGGGGVNTAERLAFANNYAALNVNDAAQAGYTNAYTFGNPVFNGRSNPAFVSGQAQANAFGYISPTMGATAAANAAQQTYSARSFYAAQGLGIASPILPGGTQNSMSAIAQSIYTRTFGNQQITNRQFNAASIQNGSLNVNLQYIGSQMGWSQATQQEYMNYLQGQVTAQNKGISASSYATLTQQAAAGNKTAQTKLKSVGIGTSAYQAQNNLNSTRMTRQEDVNETMATAFTNTTNVVNQFSAALTSLMKSTGLDKLLGAGAGITSPLSSALGGFSGAFGAGAGLLSAGKLLGGSGGLLGGLFGSGAGAAGSSTLNATMGANGVYTVTGLAGSGSALGTAAGLGAAAAPIAAGTALFAYGANWLENKALSNQYGVSIPAGYTQADFNAYQKAKAQAMTGYRGTWGRVAAQWEKNYFAANPAGAGGRNSATSGPGSIYSGRSGGGSTSVVGNTPGNGASNIGASAASVIKAAETQLGVPYVWGGENPGKGMDCSGLTQWAYKQAGVNIPRVAADQQKSAQQVPTNSTQPGDLLFMGNPAHHVVMSIGGGKIIEAPHTGAKVRIRTFSPSEFTSAGRVIGNIGNMSSLLNGNSASTSTLNDLMGMSGGDTGSFTGGTSELDAITAALSGGMGGGSLPLSASSGSAAGTSGGTGATPTGNGNNSASALQAYAKQLLAKYGWAGEWNSFNSIVMAESGWNYKARNAQSGAYGIPQALPGSKMSSAGSDWQTDGDTQLRWMMSYIKGRYGDPNAAWSFHQKNNWYSAGAWSIDKDQNATVHAGEMIIPAQQAETIRQTLVNNTFNPNVAKNSGGGSSFQFGNIYVQLPSGYSGTQQEAVTMASKIVSTMEDQLRLKNLQVGQ